MAEKRLADWLEDDQESALALHQAGGCDARCRYCEEELEADDAHEDGLEPLDFDHGL